MQQFFEYSEEVERAMRDKKPILALESTLLTHGFPYPHNFEIAKTLEDIAREHEVTPATIAIVKGKVKIGLAFDELETLIKDERAIKTSTRDIPYALAQGLNAGTTVAATLFCADFAGIRVFATGGIGGVHRGDDYDTSADLIELARTPLAVVCSGVKSILDLPKTLEFLETFSVPVIGYHTDTLPAFYTAKTPYKITARVDNIPMLVKLVKIHWQLGMSSSIVIANPIPMEHEIPEDMIEPAIQEALRVASEKEIRGKDLTPFLLTEVSKATQGKSMQANIALIKNNVKIAAMLAHAIAHV